MYLLYNQLTAHFWYFQYNIPKIIGVIQNMSVVTFKSVLYLLYIKSRASCQLFFPTNPSLEMCGKTEVIVQEYNNNNNNNNNDFIYSG